MTADLPRHSFLFLRHGETDWNRGGRIMGRTDIPLNPTGLSQAADAAKRLSGQRIARIFHSPLARASETARIVADACGADLVPVPALAECDWGAMEGQVAGAEDSEWREAWRKGAGPAGSETFFEFSKRILAGIVSTRHEGEGLPLIVSHGGVFGAFRRAAGHTDAWAGLANAVPLLCEPPVKSGQPWRIVPL